jgi:hypothetical protein
LRCSAVRTIDVMVAWLPIQMLVVAVCPMRLIVLAGSPTAMVYKGKTYGYKLIWNEGADGKPHVDYLNLVNENKKLYHRRWRTDLTIKQLDY